MVSFHIGICSLKCSFWEPNSHFAKRFRTFYWRKVACADIDEWDYREQRGMLRTGIPPGFPAECRHLTDLSQDYADQKIWVVNSLKLWFKDTKFWVIFMQYQKPQNYTVQREDLLSDKLDYFCFYKFFFSFCLFHGLLMFLLLKYECPSSWCWDSKYWIWW